MLAINLKTTIGISTSSKSTTFEALQFNDESDDDIIDRITIPMMEIGNELGPSNTHTISGEYGIGIFTLSYYNITTEPTTYTSTHNTTTVNTTIFNKNPTFTVSSFLYTASTITSNCGPDEIICE